MIFSALYSTLLHSLIKDKLEDLIERVYTGKGFLILLVIIVVLSSPLGSQKL